MGGAQEKEPGVRAHVNQLVWRGLAAGISVLGARYRVDTADEGMNSSANRLEFLFGDKTGAGPAQYSVLLRVRHCMLLF